MTASCIAEFGCSALIPLATHSLRKPALSGRPLAALTAVRGVVAGLVGRYKITQCSFRRFTQSSKACWRVSHYAVVAQSRVEISVERRLLGCLGVREARDMWIGWNEFDILLGDVHSLKSKRSVVRPIVAEIRKRFQISVAEVEDAELYQRARIGVSLVSGDRSYVAETLQRVEEAVAHRPEIELLSSKMRLVHSTDF